ncbi:hypothetical protein GCM10010985_34710 [Caballeronia grimmiae]|uniref:Uncharacterized protein n=1 Tax=Caballeronia grimmiae TaxID=1071679 RepID=A0ABQ1RT68_9BURK|nr:hypothetical protein GCM10010985_34710 [Caballeronia grimmiae]
MSALERVIPISPTIPIAIRSALSSDMANASRPLIVENMSSPQWLHRVVPAPAAMLRRAWAEKIHRIP